MSRRPERRYESNDRRSGYYDRDRERSPSRGSSNTYSRESSNAYSRESSNGHSSGHSSGYSRYDDRRESSNAYSQYNDRRGSRGDSGYSRGSRSDYGGGRGDRGGRGGRGQSNMSHGRGGYDNYSAASKEKLPELPREVPIPEGGKKWEPKGLVPRAQAGQPLTVLTNHFVIQSLPIVKVRTGDSSQSMQSVANSELKTFQYDVRMRVPVSSQRRGSEKVSAMQSAKASQQAKDLFGDGFVFDDVSLGWSRTELCPVGSERNATIQMPGHTAEKPNEVEIKIRNTGLLKIHRLVSYLESGRAGLATNDPEVDNCFKALSAVYRKDAARKFLSYPKSSAFFIRSPELSTVLHSTGGMLEAIRGIHQSLSFNFGRLSLNVDTACTAFFCPDKCLVDLVQAFAGANSVHELVSMPIQKIVAESARINGVFFVVRHLDTTEKNERKFRVQRLSPTDAFQTRFDQLDPLTGSTTPTCVEAYFRTKYGITLRYPKLPLVVTRKGSFPLELCFTAPGERFKEPLQGPETADFIKFSTSPAFVRSRQIFENVKRLEWHSQAIPKSMGLSVKPGMLELQARRLPAPAPRYARGSDNHGAASGSWNLRGKTFVKCADFKSWGVLYFGGGRNSSEQEVLEFFRSFCSSCQTTGLSTPQGRPVILPGSPHGDIESDIRNLVVKTTSAFNKRPDILFFLLSQHSNTMIYKAIKNVCEVGLGLPSQVMLVEKAFGKGGVQYQANVSMKVNVKLGGSNTFIDEPLFRKDRYMMLGADRSHCSPGEMRQNPPPPSYSALVGTYDASCVQYTGVAAAQASTSEMIEAMRPMARELLKRYKAKNGDNLPDKVILWRDGISESQIPALMETEVKALKEVREECGKRFKITVVNCVKRHHTRLFPGSESGDKLGNVYPGTMVENSSIKNDGFIVTQSALQGTCRPTHYTVLEDENNFSADDFWKLVMAGCWSYARATRSVSIHSAVYYSDLVCERARLHLRSEEGNPYKVLKNVHSDLTYTMYWQ